MTKRTDERFYAIKDLDIASRNISGTTYNGRIIQETLPPLTGLLLSWDNVRCGVIIAAEFTVGTTPVAQTWALFKMNEPDHNGLNVRNIPDVMVHVASTRTPGGETWHLYRKP